MAKLSLPDLDQGTGTGDSGSVSVSVRDIPVEEISVRENIRKEYEGIDELKASIRRYGLLQPITVYKDGERYAIKTGHRRFLAYQALYEETPELFRHIRCIISDAENIPIIQLIENVQRVDLGQRDLFIALTALKEQGLTTKQIAEVMGKSESYVKFIFIGVNEIKRDPDLQTFIASPGGSIQDVVETKGIADRDERRDLLEQRKEGTLTRAALRQKTRALKTGSKSAGGIAGNTPDGLETSGRVLPAIPCQDGDGAGSIAGNTPDGKIAYTMLVEVNKDRRNIVISFEDDLPFERIRADIKDFVTRENIVCRDLETLNV
jgi:ParB family chromosome partitioning protein